VSPLPIRVRFAPSPTGFLHIGSARTALFNWLWARHVGGEFLLRVEDTDVERSRPELIDLILDILGWMGIDWDDEPVFQSRRGPEHAAAVAQLLASGHAYRCDCTREDLDARIAARAAAGGDKRPGYDGFCRDRGVPESVPHAVRFRVPDSGETGWHDLVRGPISFEHRNLEDFVLQRTDGTPVFIVANAVDDAAMGITHVIRGEDLINVTPKVLLVRDALEQKGLVQFAHLPLIVNESRKKLSKRRDDVSVGDYRDRGFLPEALVNYLALLGWGPPDGVEVRPVAEIVELFEIADINPSPAMFDVKKLEAVNGEYIRALDAADFLERSRPFLDAAPWSDRIDDAVLDAIAPEVQTRVRVLSEAPDLVDFFFVDEPDMDEAAWQKAIAGNEAAPKILDAAIDAYEAATWDAETLHRVTTELADAAGLKLGKAQAPIRVAVTGRTVGPPLFESLAVLGRDATLTRLRAARARC
jgi:glutamyl-tRNA synthetase